MFEVVRKLKPLRDASFLARLRGNILVMDDQLSEGLIVELKSGGPRMTVKSVDGPTVVCIWFSEEKLRENQFPSACLIPANIESLSDRHLEDIVRKSAAPLT